jgi:uncharacterized protein YceK
MKRTIIVLAFLVVTLAGCGPVLSDTSSESYHWQGPTTTNTATATGELTADQTQNDNRPVCAGLFVIGSCNISQANNQVVTTARTKQDAAVAAPEPEPEPVYDGIGWTVLIIIGGLCWLMLGYLAFTGRLTAKSYAD